MKQILLTKGKYAMVDDDDFEWLINYKWHCLEYKTRKIYYAQRTIYISSGKTTHECMHREIMGCKKGDKIQIDFIDGDGLNCQRHNLRTATHAQNGMNRKSSGESIYLGVSKYSYTKKDGTVKWRADIKISERKQKCIGVFETEKEAGLAYNKYAIKYHGEFARLNKI